jgi:dihydrofolate synthase/folylpolyglutamate synthase
MVCIFGCCEDKDIPAMLEKVALGGDKVIFTRAKGNPRAADPDELQREFVERSGKMSQVAKSIQEALDLASRAVGRDDLIVVTGSFYLVGDAKKYLAEVDKKKGLGAARA